MKNVPLSQEEWEDLRWQRKFEFNCARLLIVLFFVQLIYSAISK